MKTLPAERRLRQLRVGGLTPLSTTDYPDQLAAVIFCQGCPWHCGYCHNPHLLPARGTMEIAWADVLAFLRKRQGLLDAVVFSGGEPLAQTALADAVRTVRGMGFRVGLHTGGAYPERFGEVLPMLDWVGFDFKAPIAEYPSLTNVPDSGEKALTSAQLLLESGVEHEFRTTVHPAQLTPAALHDLAGRLAAIGVRRYVLQEFRADGCGNPMLVHHAPPSYLSDRFCDSMVAKFESFGVRRAQ